MTTKSEAVLGQVEILVDRSAQDYMFTSATSFEYWISLIVGLLGKILFLRMSKEEFRRVMLEVASCAVAAVLWVEDQK